MYERFEQLLQKHGITSYKVSKDTGVTQTSLSNWKSGRSTPSIKTLQKIADYFGVSIGYLTGKENEEPNAIDKEKNLIVLDDEALELLEDLKNRPEMRTLFSISKKASAENIMKTVKIIEALEEGD